MKALLLITLLSLSFILNAQSSTDGKFSVKMGEITKGSTKRLAGISKDKIVVCQGAGYSAQNINKTSLSPEDLVKTSNKKLNNGISIRTVDILNGTRVCTGTTNKFNLKKDCRIHCR